MLQGLAEVVLTRAVCRLSERPELRACAKVVAILQPSRKRGGIVGVVREDPFGSALLLMPCDPRMPMCLIRSSELPLELKASLKVGPAPHTFCFYAGHLISERFPTQSFGEGLSAFWGRAVEDCVLILPNHLSAS